MHEREIVIQLATILLLGVSAQWLAWRFRFPSILLLLTLGLVAGPGAELATGEALLQPDLLFGNMLLPVTSLAVGVILYEGGLSLRLGDIEEVGHTVRNLVSLGALTTWILASACAWLTGVFPLELSLLLGAILIVTGPTVIGPLLRHVRPKGLVGPVLRWEGIVTDPIGAILAVLVFEVILSGTLESGLAHAVLGFLKAATVGGGLGVASGALLVFLIRRHLLPEFLENPFSLMVVVASFTLANLLQEESGLIAATVMGMWVGNVLREDARPILEFKENLQVLLIGALFIVLSARLQPADLTSVLQWRVLLFVILLVVVVRPACVLVSTWGGSFSWRERVFLSWMAPRGIVAAAVASVFGLGLAETGRAGAQALAPVTFLVILATVALYGLTAAPLARALGLGEGQAKGVLFLGAHRWALELAHALQASGATVKLIDSNYEHVRDARMGGLSAVHANVLSQYAAEDIDLSGIGSFVAMTPNDAVNALAAERFVDFFGRANVFMLNPTPAESARHDAQLKPRARLVFGQQTGFDALDTLSRQGWAVKTNRLTESFGFQSWQEKWGEDAVPLALVERDGTVYLFASDHGRTPTAGETLISLIDPSRGPDRTSSNQLRDSSAEHIALPSEAEGVSG